MDTVNTGHMTQDEDKQGNQQLTMHGHSQYWAHDTGRRQTKPTITTQKTKQISTTKQS
jgi:calcineurin-like phosphoesterase family protein